MRLVHHNHFVALMRSMSSERYYLVVLDPAGASSVSKWLVHDIEPLQQLLAPCCCDTRAEPPRNKAAEGCSPCYEQNRRVSFCECIEHLVHGDIRFACACRCLHMGPSFALALGTLCALVRCELLKLKYTLLVSLRKLCAVHRDRHRIVRDRRTYLQPPIELTLKDTSKHFVAKQVQERYVAYMHAHE